VTHTRPVTKRGPRNPASDFSDLERAFFEAAPPEIAVVPPEALRFDDLEPVGARTRPERRRRPRVERRPREEKRQRPFAERPSSPFTFRLAEAWRLSRLATGRAWHHSLVATARWSRAAWQRGRVWSGPYAQRARQSFVAGLSMARASVARRARATLARLAAELPGERLRGKTLAAMVAVAVFVVIAAGVVAQRPALSAPRADTTTLAP
jgi:hypothetical protein